MKSKKQTLLTPYFIFILFVLIHLTNVNANTLYVGPSETYTTISDAVTASVAGDTIIVKDGTYTEIVFVEKALIIQAENQHQAILGGEGNAIIALMVDNITIDGFEFNASELCGITIRDNSSGHSIRNNYLTSGAIGCSDDYTEYSNLTITGNTLENIDGEDPPLTMRGNGHTIENNTIHNCDHGIVITDVIGNAVTVRNNQITNNVGVSVLIEGAAILRGNTIENNEIGILIHDSTPDLGQDSDTEARNNIIRNNTDHNVRNESPNTIPAYRNYWGLTNSIDIDATIQDDDEDGSFGPVNFDPFLTVSPTAVELTFTEGNIPETTTLSPAYPNPFNPETRISYKLSEGAQVTLKVVDLMGRTVQTIVTGEYQIAGSYSTYWNSKTDLGHLASSGMYLLVLNAGSIITTQKAMLIR